MYQLFSIELYFYLTLLEQINLFDRFYSGKIKSFELSFCRKIKLFHFFTDKTTIFICPLQFTVKIRLDCILRN